MLRNRCFPVEGFACVAADAYTETRGEPEMTGRHQLELTSSCSINVGAASTQQPTDTRILLASFGADYPVVCNLLCGLACFTLLCDKNSPYNEVYRSLPYLSGYTP